MSRTDVLVAADWAEAHLTDPSVVSVEVDEDVSASDTGHLAAAVRLDRATELQAGVRDVIDREAFQELLSAKGISNDDTVVLCGGNDNWFAADAFWYFTPYGHQDVRLLDGGRTTWELDGRPLTTDVVDRPRAEYRASEQDLILRAQAEEVRDAENDDGSSLQWASLPDMPAHNPQTAA